MLADSFNIFSENKDAVLVVWFDVETSGSNGGPIGVSGEDRCSDVGVYLGSDFGIKSVGSCGGLLDGGSGGYLGGGYVLVAISGGIGGIGGIGAVVRVSSIGNN
jgi:hypothetical protein